MVRGWTRPSTGQALPSLNQSQVANLNSRRGEYDGFEFLERLAWPREHREADERQRARRAARRSQSTIESSPVSSTAPSNQTNASAPRAHDTERSGSGAGLSPSLRSSSETRQPGGQASTATDGRNTTHGRPNGARREAQPVPVNTATASATPAAVNVIERGEDAQPEQTIAAYYAEPLPLYTRRPQVDTMPPPTYTKQQTDSYCANCGPRAQSHYLSSNYIRDQCWAVYLAHDHHHHHHHHDGHGAVYQTHTCW